MQAKITKRFLDKLAPKDKLFEVYDTELKNFNARIQPSGRKVFYYTYRMEGSSKRKRIMLGVFPNVSVEQARDLAQGYAGDIAKGVDVQQKKTKARRESGSGRYSTFADYLENYYRDWAEKNHKTHKVNLEKIESGFKDFLPLPLDQITYEKVERWQMQQKKQGLKPSTINRKTGALRGALSRAVDLGLLADHPLKKLKDLKVDKTPIARYLSRDENQRLMTALADRDKDLKQARERGNAHRAQRGYPLLPPLLDCAFADRMTPLILLSLKTGLRQGEAFDLLWQHVNVEQRVIVVVGGTAKSGNTRTIPMTPLVYETLKAWQQQAPTSTRVFPADNGGRLDNVRKSWASILKTAKIEGFRWHDMRHDFASQLVMKGVPLNTVRELCGHAQFETTLRYANLSSSHKAEAVALLDT